MSNPILGYSSEERRKTRVPIQEDCSTAGTLSGAETWQPFPTTFPWRETILPPQWEAAAFITAIVRFSECVYVGARKTESHNEVLLSLLRVHILA